MQKLDEDIAWHERQIRLTREALAAADIPSNPSREIDTGMLLAAVARLELTLKHLRELRDRGA